jgi:HD-like signal output (HDOD) protein
MAAAPKFSDQGGRLHTIMNQINEIAVLPHVVYKVLELAGSDDSSALEIERAIVVDPGFSARILSLANSAYMALPKRVSSIKDSIMFCGVKSVRELAMTVGVYDMFVGKGDKSSVRRRTWWRQSLDSAVCAKYLAQTAHRVPPDEAYTCGLLHLIGKTLLCRFGGDDYEQVENLVEAGFSVIDAEFEVFGVNHVELAGASAQKWGFPPVVRSGMAYAVIPSPDEEFAAHRAVVALAHDIAEYVMKGTFGSHGEVAADPNAWYLSTLGISTDNLQQIIDGGASAIASAQAFSA